MGGMEIPPENVFLAQKMMIAKCNMKGKPVITATQMLESMCGQPRPTRAEASDVANAVLDGTDCVMLSGETAAGSFPLNAVSVMRRICQKAEAALDHSSSYHSICQGVAGTSRPLDAVESVCASAVKAAMDTDAPLILALTETGHTARMLAISLELQFLQSQQMVLQLDSYFASVVSFQWKQRLSSAPI